LSKVVLAGRWLTKVWL
jgi:hypothetical protein